MRMTCRVLALIVAMSCLHSRAFAQVLMREVLSREVSLGVGTVEAAPMREVVSREHSLHIENGRAGTVEIISRECSLVNVTPSAPPSVTGLVATASPTGDLATLNWISYNQWSIGDIVRFDIYVSDTGPIIDVTGMTPYQSVGGDTSNAAVSSLTPFRDHYFAVVAVDGLGNYSTLVNYAAAYVISPEVVSREFSLFNGHQDHVAGAELISREMDLVVVTPQAPPTITEATVASSPSGDAATLDWSGYNQWLVADIARFDIYFSDAGPIGDVAGLTPYARAGGGLTSLTLSGLTEGRDHYFAIVAVDGLGNYLPAVRGVAAYVISPEVVSREVSIFVGQEPPNPPPVVEAQSIANGSFESLAVSNFIYWGAMNVGQRTAFGWTGEGNGSNGPALFKNGSSWGYANVPDGTQAVSLQGTSSISQVHDFSVAGLYILRWKAASRGGQVNPYVIQVDGTPVSITFSTSSTAWQEATCQFTVGTPGSHTIAFAAQNTGGGDRSVAVDDISLSRYLMPVTRLVSHMGEVISREVGAVVANASVPATVVGFTAKTSSQSYRAIDLDWSNYNELTQQDVVRYRIYLDTTLFSDVTGMTPAALVPAGMQTTTVADLEGNQIYYCAVVAEDAAGNFNPAVSSVSVQSSIGEAWLPDAQSVTYNGTVLINGATIRSAGTLSASGAAGAGVMRVDFLVRSVNGIDALLMSDTTAGDGFTAFWDAAAMNDGGYVFTIRAYDNVGRLTELTRTVTLKFNSPPVISGLTFNQAALNDGAILTRSGTLGVAAIDSDGVNLAEFFIAPPAGGTRTSLGTDANAANGLERPLGLESVDDGSYDLIARVYDQLGTFTEGVRHVSVMLAPPSAPTIATPANGSTATSATVQVSGTAAASATLTVYNNDVVAFTGAPNVNGSFSVTVSLADGANAIRAVSSNRAGLGTSSNTVNVTRVPPPPLLSLELSQVAANEGASLSGAVSIDRVLAQPLTVLLGVTQMGRLTFPASVVIAAGELSATFAIQVVQNQNVEPSVSVDLIASASGITATTTPLQLLDDDLPISQFTLSQTVVSEKGTSGALSGTVTLNHAAGNALAVVFTSAPAGHIVMPRSVGIPAQVSTVTVPITVLDNSETDGNRVVAITAHLTTADASTIIGDGAPVNLMISDDEGPSLSIELDRHLFIEGRNPAGNGVVKRSGGGTGAISVNLAPSNPGKVKTPIAVTIPAGQSSAGFPIQAMNDGQPNGMQTVSLVATATGYNPAGASFLLSDIGKPDLVVTLPDSPATAETDATVDVKVVVTNQGATEALGPFTQRLLLSSDSSIGNDVLLGQINFTGRLVPGAAAEQTLRVRLPREAGRYWLVGQADANAAVDEILEDNNTAIAGAATRIDAAYSATVATAVDTVPANTPIPMAGTATRQNGAPAASSLVNIHILRGETDRIITALTDSTGAFVTTWQPLPGEGGSYQIGACHPGVKTTPLQDAFTILTMETDFPSQTVELAEGGNAGFSGQIRNPTDRQLTGIALAAIDAPTGLILGVTLPGTSLGAGQGMNVAVTVMAANGFSGERTVALHLTTDQGVQLNIPVKISVKPLVPKLEVRDATLAASAVRGAGKSVTFTITNAGSSETGPVAVLLPNLRWLSVVTPSPLPSIPAGGSVPVSLLLQPLLTDPLTLHSGNLVLSPAHGRALNVPFQFRIVSDQTGDLAVDVVDEYFFFTAEAPKVSGAKVTVRDAVTADEVTNAVTHESGAVSFAGLTEGWYTVEVESPDHTRSRANYFVRASEPNAQRIFISRNLVTYTWTVEPIQIQDRYKISVETTFETNVPAPVVTVEPASLDLSDLNVLGQTKLVNMTIENHGLIAAEDSHFDFGTHPFYEITPLIQNVGKIPAKSSLVVPVVIKRIGEFAEDGAIRTVSAAASASPRVGAPERSTNGGREGVPCGQSGNFIWDYLCGGHAISKQTPIATSGGEGSCPGGPGSPGGRPEGRAGGGGPSSSSVTFSLPSICDCSLFKELCLDGKKKADLEGIGHALAGALSKALPPWITITGVDVSVEAGGKLCICCKDGDYSLSGQGNASAHISASAVIGLSTNAEVSADGPGWTNVSASVSALAGATAEVSGDVSLTFDKPCLEDGSLCISGSIQMSGFAGVKLEGSASATLNGIGYSGEARGVLGVNGSARASVKGCLDGSLEYEACASLNPEATLSLTLHALGHPDQTLGGSLDLRSFQTGSCSSDAQRERLARENVTQLANEPEPVRIVVPGKQYLRADKELIAQEFPNVFKTDGVCAKVKIRLDQEAVMTRSAFRAALDLSNNRADGSLTNVGFDLDIRDAGLAPANDVFNVRVTDLHGIAAIDGTGQIGPSATGGAQWTLIPRDTAAPLQDTVYFIGGTISYVQNGTTLHVPVEPTRVMVRPDAALYLKYFHQRDVFGDDPHTDAVEPSIPYALSVMVENRGAGAAHDLSITSAEPEIYENEKGLLIDFQIVDSEVAGQSALPSLTATFGDMAPGERKIATWHLTSTLQGLFTDYKATFQHFDGFGDSRISLIKETQIHEMIHQVRALRELDDGLPDFLVNDVPDINDRPDTVHLSDGTIAPVSVVELGSASGPVTLQQMLVTVTASMPAGWVYLRIPDPANGRFVLKQVVRSDGLPIPVGVNTWTTDRTFIGLGQRPTMENILHLFDRNSTGQYKLLYETAPAADVAPPSSRVGALPQQSPLDFGVTWIGSDNQRIGYFDIFVSVDGGSFSLWKEHTMQTSAIYPGELGHSYGFYSRATDGAGNKESDRMVADTITTVSVTNQGPDFPSVPNQQINEGGLFTYQLSASDPDGAGDSLTWSLATPAPAGLTLNPATGFLTWQTGENDGGQMVKIGVQVTDRGTPLMSASQTMAIQVNEVNQPPVLQPIRGQHAIAGAAFTLTAQASDADRPLQPIRYRLGTGAPAGMTIHDTTGLLQWVPAKTLVGQTLPVTIIAADNATPAAEAVASFPIVVEADPADITQNATKMRTPDQPAAPVTSTDVPFSANLAGTYAGLLLPMPEDHATRGFMRATVAKLGAFTGKVRLGKSVVTLRGTVRADGQLDVPSVARTDYRTNLHLQKTAAEGKKIIGTVTRTLPTGSVEYRGDFQRAETRNKANPSPDAGRYTLLIPAAVPGVNEPDGDGYGVVLISIGGKTRVTGALGDGSPLSQGGMISVDREWPFFAAPANSENFLAGPVRVRDVPGVSDFDGQTLWTRRASGRLAGFFAERKLIGARYRPPAKGERALSSLAPGAGSTLLFLSGASVPAGLGPWQLNWDAKNRLTYSGTDKISGVVNSMTGLISGSLNRKNPPFSTGFHGVVFQKQGVAGGNFKNSTASGVITIQPQK